MAYLGRLLLEVIDTMDTHTQCTIQKNNLVDVAWIPTKLAVQGNYTSLKNNGEWDDGWLILETHETIDSKILNENRNDYRHLRKATDI